MKDKKHLKIDPETGRITCLKKCFETKSKAKKALKKCNQLGMKMNAIYYCDMCYSYHLTSMNKQSSRDLGRYLKNKKTNNES